MLAIFLTSAINKNYKMFDEKQMQHFYDVALQAGIKNLIKE